MERTPTVFASRLTARFPIACTIYLSRIIVFITAVVFNDPLTRLAVFSSAVAHPGLVRCMGRYLLFVLAPTLLASCAPSPMTPREAESARVNSEPWDPDHHDDTSGFTNRDLASLLNGLTGLAG